MLQLFGLLRSIWYDLPHCVLCMPTFHLYAAIALFIARICSNMHLHVVIFAHTPWILFHLFCVFIDWDCLQLLSLLCLWRPSRSIHYCLSCTASVLRFLHALGLILSHNLMECFPIGRSTTMPCYLQSRTSKNLRNKWSTLKRQLPWLTSKSKHCELCMVESIWTFWGRDDRDGFGSAYFCLFPLDFYHFSRRKDSKCASDK